MIEHRELSEKYAEIAADLINTEPLLESIRQSEATIIDRYGFDWDLPEWSEADGEG